MTRPTRSPRRAHQRAARGQRKGSGFDYTIMVEFFDQLEGRDRLTFEDMYTLWDVYELSDRHQGQLVLSDERVRRRTIRAVGRVSSHDSGFDIECLSLQTQEELDRFRGLGIDRMVEHFAATVDRANISKQPERKSGEWLPMRPYCVSLQAKAGSKKPLNTASVLNILRLGGFGNEHTNVRDTTAGPRYEISVIAAAYLDTYEFPERASPQDKPLTLFAVEHGVSVSKAIELLQGAGIPLSERRSHSGLATPGRYILEECLDAANAAMSNRFTITPEEAQSRFVTIPELAARNGIESSTGIAGFIAYYKSQPEQHWVPGRDGFVAHYPKDIGEIVDYHYSLPRLTGSQIALEHLLSDFIEEDADKFTRFLHEKGYIQQFSPARYLPRQKSQAAAKGDPNQQVEPEADKQLHWVYTLQCSRADARRFVREFMIGLAAARSQHPDIGEASALATPEDAISSFENVGLLAKECRCDPGATKFILEKIIKSAHFSSITYKGGELFVKKFLANDFRRMCEEVVSSRLVTEEVSAYTVAEHIKETYGQSLEEYGIKFTEASVWNLARDLRLTCRLRLTDEIQPIVTLFYPKKELWKIDNFVKSDIARRQAFARPSSP